MKKLLLLISLSLTVSFAQYTTPNTAVNWNLDSLVLYSGGVVTGSFPNYSINGLITVSATDRIEVQPSSFVTFTATTAGFEVNGIFRAIGTQNLIITFTATNPDSLGAYQGFRFNDTSNDELCKIDYAIIQYAYYGFRCVDANPSLENSYLFKCRRGIQLSSSSPKILNNVIERSFEYGITLTLGSSPIIEYNTFYNNNTQNTSPKNQISVGTQGNNSPIIRHNIIRGGWNNRTGGISISALLGGSASSSEIAYNQIFDNSFGIVLGGGTLTCYVHHNKIYNNNINPDPMTTGSGINVNGNSSNIPIIAHNEIYGNWWGITIQNGSNIVAGPQPNLGNLTNSDTTDDGYNSIYNNIQGTNIYDLFNNCSNDIYAQNNDWRVYDSTSIDAHVVHKADDPARGTVFFTPFSSFIPVELISFNLITSETGVEVKWSTASETNNMGFEILRRTTNSNNNGEWIKAAFINGNGNSTEVKEYTFLDKLSSNGHYEYRLIQVDYNGEKKIVTESSIEYLLNQIDFKLIQNYPNPFNPSTKIRFSLPHQSSVSLEVFNTMGERVSVLVNETKEAGNYSINFDAFELSSGIYFCQLRAGNFVQSIKMLLIK